LLPPFSLLCVTLVTHFQLDIAQHRWALVVRFAGIERTVICYNLNERYLIPLTDFQTCAYACIENNFSSKPKQASGN